MKELEELINKASRTTYKEEMIELTKHPNTSVRRALARNKNASQEALEILATDPTINVVYQALKNPNCRVQRVINQKDLINCVVCEVQEIEALTKCKDCNKERN